MRFFICLCIFINYFYFIGPILVQSKFGNSPCNESNQSLSNFSGLKPSILRPSQLSTITIAPGPSTKSPSDSQQSQSSTKISEKTVLEKDNSTDKNGKSADEQVDIEHNNTENSKKESAKVAAPKFLPLATNPKENNSTCNTIGTVNNLTTSFVFGQNIKDRVTVGKNNDSSEVESKKCTKEDSIKANKSSELLFSNVAAVCGSTTKSGLTLSQAAHEVEEANRASKRKYNQVILLTGEEEEVNILQINCKLFTFDKVILLFQIKKLKLT